MHTTARPPSTPGTRVTVTIPLAGGTGLEACREATSAARPASTRVDTATARSAKTLGVGTTPPRVPDLTPPPRRLTRDRVAPGQLQISRSTLSTTREPRWSSLIGN